MPEMVTSTYQNLVRNILALVLGTLKIFTRATRKCHLKGKIVLCAPPAQHHEIESVTTITSSCNHRHAGKNFCYFSIFFYFPSLTSCKPAISI